MKCLHCGKTMSKKLQKAYKYTASGLDNIVLLSIPLYTCPSCHDEEITIPNPEKLHKLIAHDLAEQSQRLLPEEIRYLRSHIGFSGIDFATTVGVTAETVSRWENGGLSMSVSHERFLRTLILCEYGPIRNYFETLRNLATTPSDRKLRKSFLLKKDGWKVAA